MATLWVAAAFVLAGCGDPDEATKVRQPATEPSKPARGGGAATAPSGQTSRLQVTVEPATAGSSRKPRGLTLQVSFRFGTTTGASPSPTSALLLRANTRFDDQGNVGWRQVERHFSRHPPVASGLGSSRGEPRSSRARR